MIEKNPPQFFNMLKAIRNRRKSSHMYAYEQHNNVQVLIGTNFAHMFYLQVDAL